MTQKTMATKTKPKPKTTKVTPITLRTMDRAAKALEMKRDGATYDAIGKKLGITRQAAWKLIQNRFADIRKQTEESAEDVRDQQLMRLDGFLFALRGKVKRGDPRAIDSALRIEDRRAKLLGLDAPSRTEVSGPDGGAIEIEDARGQLAEALARLAPQDEPEPGPSGDSDAAG
jgi:hypothetical protein